MVVSIISIEITRNEGKIQLLFTAGRGGADGLHGLSGGGPDGPGRAGRASFMCGKTDTPDYLMYHTVHQSVAPEPQVTKNGP